MHCCRLYWHWLWTERRRRTVSDEDPGESCMLLYGLWWWWHWWWWRQLSCDCSAVFTSWTDHCQCHLQRHVSVCSQHGNICFTDSCVEELAMKQRLLSNLWTFVGKTFAESSWCHYVNFDCGPVAQLLQPDWWNKISDLAEISDIMTSRKGGVMFLPLSVRYLFTKLFESMRLII